MSTRPGRRSLMRLRLSRGPRLVRIGREGYRSDGVQAGVWPAVRPLSPPQDMSRTLVVQALVVQARGEDGARAADTQPATAAVEEERRFGVGAQPSWPGRSAKRRTRRAVRRAEPPRGACPYRSE